MELDSLSSLEKREILFTDIKNAIEVNWINNSKLPNNDAIIRSVLNLSDIDSAEARLRRFAPFIKMIFPETVELKGIIESPLVEVPELRKALNREKIGANLAGKLYMKMDSQLPVGGSVKARGGIYEVLKYTEDLAVKNGVLESYEDDYCKLASPAAKAFFSTKKLHIGSTGNLGLSVGLMGKAIGYEIIVHMSSDAAEWKKELLRSKGVIVKAYEGDYVEAVNFINQQKAVRKDDLFIVSVDMPSGVNADNGQICQAAVKADATVTFNQVKIGQLMYPGCEQVGRLYVEDAGITGESFLGKEPEAFFYDGDIDKLLPSRKKDSNKGSNGKVLIIAGSTDISGACILCATAALRSGSGMIRVFTSSANAVAVKTLLPEAILDVYEEDENFESKLEKAFEWSTQAVLGPGIGTLSTGKKLVRSVLKSYDKSLVVDADAINIIAEDKKLRNLAANYATGGKRLILTPHLAEFARLYGKSVKECKDNILEYPRLLASELHCTVVCKDARTIIADGYEKKIYINVSGNDGMATAGSGDVLSGIMGAFICDKQSSFEAACLSCYLHGLCGDAAAKRLGKHFMAASDITSELANLLD